ncbi:GvpL/GvpF family gas vesicle protein [Streptomyces sp. NPDC096176]|uniref:GvpL/GvpF family gas vesicle protein n=1 Tax=Streptomyces sp. NPDC096176 TaxID=3366079 RepID=UPI00380F339B
MTAEDNGYVADNTYVTYVYAVARDTGVLRKSMAGLVGVAGAPVRLVSGGDAGDITFVASSASALDFDEQALRRHLEDLEWLEAVARAHNAVIETLGAATTVLPLRLATVYLGDDRARDALESDRAEFARLLTRLEGHVEWGVKIYVEAPEEAPEPTAPSAASDTGLSPGRAYLRRRRDQRHLRDDAHLAARTAAERIEAAGRAYATDRARHRVQQGELAGSNGENVVNDAYLLAEDRADAFRAEVAQAADDLPGVRVEITGPWAPYSFTAPVDTAVDVEDVDVEDEDMDVEEGGRP